MDAADRMLPELSPEAMSDLKRYAAYGWMPAVTARILRRKYALSLSAHDVALLFSRLRNNAQKAADAPEITTFPAVES